MTHDERDQRNGRVTIVVVYWEAVKESIPNDEFQIPGRIFTAEIAETAVCGTAATWPGIPEESSPQRSQRSQRKRRRRGEKVVVDMNRIRFC
jgi:hypothetical protein